MRAEILPVAPSLRLAAEEAIKSCGPVLARSSRSLLDTDQARELDQAKAALLDLAKALESDHDR